LIGRATRTAILTLVGVAVALAAFELAARLFFPAFDPSGQFRFVHEAVGGLMLGEPDTIARQRKNTGDYDVTVRINARGLRDDKDVAQARTGDIAVVGDSFAWGWGMQAEERFSDRLQSLTGKRVYNVATPTDLAGYGRLIDYARTLGGRFGTVVLAICMENDVYEYGPSPDGGAGMPRESLRDWLERNSAGYLFFTTVVHQTAWLKAPAVWLGLITPNLEGIARNSYSDAAIDSSAAKVAELAKKDRLIAVIIPSRALWVGDNRVVEDRVHKGFIAALGRAGVDVVDLRPLFEAGGSPLAYHFANDGHWNAKGHRLAAEAIARKVGNN
jgi:lysophospholipase L1-like esterase